MRDDDDARVFYNKKCMKRIHSKRADVSKNEENSASDNYRVKRKAKEKSALLIIIIIIINALNLKKRSSLTLREEER